MNDYLFRIKRNIPFLIRGVFFQLFMFFRKNVHVGYRLRVDSGAKLIMHPKAYVTIKDYNFIGKGSFISVLPKGKLVLGKGVGVGNNNQIVCHHKIEIGDGTILGPNVMIFDHNHQFDFRTGVKHKSFDVGEIVIGKNCWLGAGCTILKDVHIADNVVIGAGSVVTKDIPSGTIVAGVPAKIIKLKA